MEPEQPAPSTDLAQLEQKIDAMYRSVEQTRKYFLYTLIASAAVVVLPVIGLMFAIPQFLTTLPTAQDLELLQDF